MEGVWKVRGGEVSSPLRWGWQRLAQRFAAPQGKGNILKRSKDYGAIFLDLFETIVLFDSGQLPPLRVDGREIRSTLPYLYDVLRRSLPLEERRLLPTLPRFGSTMLALHEELFQRKRVSFREIPSTERFARLLERLGIPDRDGLSRQLAEEHIRHLLSCTHFPYRGELETLARRYPLALVSNFDHAAGGWALLERLGIRRFFRSVSFSGEVGYIKPHPGIFQKSLEEVEVAPQSVLFVGDTPEADIEGARALGMETCWIARRGRAFPEGY
ncbi:MAG: HAD family hydrolase, partial [Deltaproteobacteria bacterium]